MVEHEFKYEFHLDVPQKIRTLAEKGGTAWYVLQIVDPDMEWREALNGARVRINGGASVLHTSNGGELGIHVDAEALPAHMLVLNARNNEVFPAGRISACVKMGRLLPTNDSSENEDGLLKIVPVPRSESSIAALAFWRLGASIPEDGFLKTLLFKGVKEKRESRSGILFGSFQCAPKMRLVARAKRRERGLGCFLIGGVSEGSRKMYVHEAEVYWVERDGEFGRNKAEEIRLEAEERKAMDFRTQRGEAIKLSANVKKRRQEDSKELRQVDDTKVVDIDECLTQLNARASSVEDMESIKEYDADMHRKKLLPEFDMTASETGLIFARGLENMFPRRLAIAEKLLSDHDLKLTALLQKSSLLKSKSQGELEEIVRSPFIASVACKRAEASSSEQSRPYDEAEMTAKKFGLLNLLIKLCQGKKPRQKLADFQGETGLPENSAMARHLFEYFLEGNQTGDRKLRKLDKAKTFCHLAVLALDLSLSFNLDFQPLREELGMDLREIVDQLRYVGCEVNKTTTGVQVKLDTSLKAPLSFQSLSRGKARGKRKRT